MTPSVGLRSSDLSCAARRALPLLLACAAGGTAAAQSPFATQVVSYVQGSGGGIFVTDNALGGPQGGGFGLGSLDVLSLGDGGELVLGFDVAIQDGPGADFTVFENGFVISGTPTVFAEVIFVEVSTDGVNFARFPSRYAPAGGSEMGAYSGLCGGLPVLADVTTGLVDPLNPVVSGGESFDLADLASDPLVLSSQLDLNAVNFVRLIDVVAGSLDSFGTPIVDSGPADVDAVAVLNSDVATAADGPVCDLFIDAAGSVNLVLGDPDGFFTLDFASLQASINLSPVSFSALLPLFQVTSFTATELHLTSAPLAGSGVLAALAVSVQDLAGAASGDQVMIQG
ncbi:MAG: hypothetical protein AAF682_02645 [Planctomycetota bacterium]